MRSTGTTEDNMIFKYKTFIDVNFMQSDSSIKLVNKTTTKIKIYFANFWSNCSKPLDDLMVMCHCYNFKQNENI